MRNVVMKVVVINSEFEVETYSGATVDVDNTVETIIDDIKGETGIKGEYELYVRADPNSVLKMYNQGTIQGIVILPTNTKKSSVKLR